MIEMTYKLNGINYTEMLLTDEELAVVKAMRKPGTMVNVRINFETEEEAVIYTKDFPNRKSVWTFNHPDIKLATTTTDEQKVSIYANYEKKD